MNKFDEIYDIRRIAYDEIPILQDYIDSIWKKNHILARDRRLFEYEYVQGDIVNFVVAINRKTSKICGMIGYIVASSEDRQLDIWPTMWKVDEDALPLLGIELYKRLSMISGARYILGCGNNRSTSSILLDVIMKYKNMKMNHFYRLASIEEYKVAKICYKPLVGNCVITDKELEASLVEDVDYLKKCLESLVSEESIPYKDAGYYIRRYFYYPNYKYQIWEIKVDKKIALVFSREQEYNESCILRIVDYVGEDELFSYTYNFFDKLLDKYEYIDFYEYGFNEEYIRSAGFSKIEENDKNIIPNYFSPYVASNIDIWVSSGVEGARFFKADGDQDRPN